MPALGAAFGYEPGCEPVGGAADGVGVGPVSVEVLAAIAEAGIATEALNPLPGSPPGPTATEDREDRAGGLAVSGAVEEAILARRLRCGGVTG